MITRIWLVSELYYPEQTSTGYYMTHIAEGLARHHDVRVLCGQPNYQARGTVARRREMHNGVTIERCAGTTLDKNVLPYRLLNMLSLTLSIFFKAILRFRPGDDVLVVTTPPSLPFVVALACWMRKAKFVLLIHDNYPEILVAVGKLDGQGRIARLLNRFNADLYAAASQIIVVGRDMRELVARKSGVDESRITIIPNWAELDAVKPRPREENALLSELGLQDKIVFLYAGNLGYPNDVETIVECAQRLTGHTRVHFLFIGTGAKKKWLDATAQKLALTNVTILGPRPRSDQINFLNACDVSLVSLIRSMWGVSMPSRTYNALASGKAIIGITEPGSELAMVIGEDELGWIVPPHDPDALVKAVLDAASDRTRLELYGKRARNVAETRYRVDQAVTKYLGVFEQVSVA